MNKNHDRELRRYYSMKDVNKVAYQLRSKSLSSFRRERTWNAYQNIA